MPAIHPAVVLAALLLSTSAVAQAPQSPPPSPLFQQLDRNHDQMISRPEAAASNEVESEFRALDRDGDGDLDRHEFARFEVSGGDGGHPPPALPGDPRQGPEPENLPEQRR